MPRASVRGERGGVVLAYVSLVPFVSCALDCLVLRVKIRCLPSVIQLPSAIHGGRAMRVNVICSMPYPISKDLRYRC